MKLSLVLFLIASALSHSVVASPYFEGGTSVSTMKNAGNYFNLTGASSSGLGFTGSFNVFVPVTDQRNFFHLDLGLENRFTTGSSSTNSLAIFTASPSVRLEFWRIYLGAGYSPITFGSSKGLMSMHISPDTHAYFVEGGLIWRVVPELQILAVAGLEVGSTKTSSASPTINEFGLRFRFPLDPKENAQHGVKYDGYRYPFGVMR